MTYKEIVKYAEEQIGPVYYFIFGKLNQKYRQKFLISCIDAFPENKKKENSYDRTRYLAGICRKQATKDSYKKRNIFNLDGF